MPPTVLISYSHQDAPWRERLAGQLRVLEREGLLQLWHDGLIEPGVSVSFLDSDFIRRRKYRRSWRAGGGRACASSR
jgi:hypothetical protein